VHTGVQNHQNIVVFLRTRFAKIETEILSRFFFQFPIAVIHLSSPLVRLWGLVGTGTIARFSQSGDFRTKYPPPPPSAHSAGAYTATLLVRVNVMKGGGRAPPTLNSQD
jgi:hypothetical protein